MQGDVWSTMSCVVGLEIDTVEGTTGVPEDKLDRIRSLLERRWPKSRGFAPESALLP